MRVVRPWLLAAGQVLRGIIGAPDYEEYLRHIRDRHPGDHPMPRDQFERETAATRHSRPGARCC